MPEIPTTVIDGQPIARETVLPADSDFTTMPYASFKQHLIDRNNQARQPDDTGNNGDYDGQNVHIEEGSSLLGVSYVKPPYFGDKDQLLEYALKKAQETNDPEVSPLILGVAVNMVHPFGDGNGRVSRGIYREARKSFGAELLTDPQEVMAKGARVVDLGTKLPMKAINGEVAKPIYARLNEVTDAPKRLETDGVVGEEITTDDFVTLAQENRQAARTLKYVFMEDATARDPIVIGALMQAGSLAEYTMEGDKSKVDMDKLVRNVDLKLGMKILALHRGFSAARVRLVVDALAGTKPELKDTIINSLKTDVAWPLAKMAVYKTLDDGTRSKSYKLIDSHNA